MATNGYQAGGVYALASYTGASGLGFPTLYLAGASLSAPTGSNLPAPAPVGRYGSFVGPTANNNFAGSGLSTESKQLPMRFGKNHAWVTFAGIARGSAAAPIGPPKLPAYGN